MNECSDGSGGIPHIPHIKRSSSRDNATTVRKNADDSVRIISKKMLTAILDLMKEKNYCVMMTPTTHWEWGGDEDEEAKEEGEDEDREDKEEEEEEEEEEQDEEGDDEEDGTRIVS